MAGRGKSPALVQKVVGHADIGTTMIYAHLVTEDLRALAEPAPKAPGSDGQAVVKSAEK